MAQKSGYRAYKAAGYRFPLLATLLNTSYIYLIAVLAGVLAVTIFLTAGMQALHHMQQPLPEHSEYLKVDPATTPAGDWAKAFVTTPPPNITKWTPSSATEAREPYSFSECNSFSLALPEQYGAYSASGAEASVLVQLYAPGRAKVALQSYKDKLSQCWKVTETRGGSPETTVYSWERGFVFSYGDVLVWFRSDNNTLVGTLLPWYLSHTPKTLTDSKCLNLTVTPQDATRNLYFDSKSYTGLILKDTVRANVKVDDFPSPVYPDMSTPNTRQAPEGPLAPEIPQAPNAPAKPTIPEDTASQDKPVEKTISYQNPDDEGPGCGWAWSSTKAPVVDKKTLQATKDKLYADAQNEVNSNAQAYVDAKLAFARNSLLTVSSIEGWNAYVTQANAVYAKWDWLDAERAKVKTSWYNYVQAHDAWMNFDNNKYNAQKQYEQDQKTCQDAQKALDDYHKKWDPTINAPAPTGTPTTVPTTVTVTPNPYPTTVTVTPPAASSAPSGSPAPAPKPVTSVSVVTPPPTVVPTTVTVTSTPPPKASVPPAPAGCSAPPAEPSILKQDKPAEPQAPSLPTGVTIPASWPKPITSPSVKKVS